MDLQKLEMITCPRCGQPFPKKRQELGYNYCVNCSTEKQVTYIIEGTKDGDGDDTVLSTMHIVSQEEADNINRARGMLQNSVDSDLYGIPDMRVTEDQDLPENTEEEPDSEEPGAEEE